MAATLGIDGRPNAPTVYLAMEDSFYTYNDATGIFEKQREENISAKISANVLKCSRDDCRDLQKFPSLI